MFPKNSSRDFSFTLKRCCPQTPICAGSEQFPDDVLIDILCRLPVKNLMRYKRVCKLWHRLISYECVPRISFSLPPISGFILRTEDNHYTSTGEIFMDYLSYADPDCMDEASTNPSMLEDGEPENEGFVYSYSALLPFKPSPDDLLDVCKGLLLFVNGPSSSGPQYYVCNPMTKQLARIPKASFHGENCFASLAFDPCESAHYKVVSFPNSEREPVPDYQLLDIFSSDTGRWVRHRISVETSDTIDDESLVLRRSCYFNGVLYRLALSKRLLSFNIRKVTRQAIALPRTDGMEEDHGLLGVSNGLLHYANKDISGMKVWVLNDAMTSTCRGNNSNEFWILKHSVTFNDTIYWFPMDGYIYTSPMAVDKTFKLYAIDPISDIIYIGNSRAITTYDINSKVFKLFYSMHADRHRNVFLGEFYVYCHSHCYVVLNQFTDYEDSY